MDADLIANTSEIADLGLAVGAPAHALPEHLSADAADCGSHTVEQAVTEFALWASVQIQFAKGELSDAANDARQAAHALEAADAALAGAIN